MKPLRRASVHQLGEVNAGADAQPGEDVPHVMVDRPSTQKKMLCHLAIRGSGRGQASDLKLLRGQRVGDRDLPVLDVVAGGSQFRSRLLYPQWNLEPLEGFQRMTKMLAGRAGPAGAPQLLPVQQLGTRLVELGLA